MIGLTQAKDDFRQLLPALWLLFLLPVEAAAVDEIGRMDRVSGTAELLRAGAAEIATPSLLVQMQDVVRTGSGDVGILFVDDTRVDVTPQSVLTIDEFVYDPATGTGALAIRNTLGTLRYVSGQIAKHSAERVVIRTPTASVGVRGTEFSVSVDEAGRSAFVLLPTCSDDGLVCKVGSIEVVTDAGAVILSQAYEMTVVETSASAPSVPVTVSLTVPQIGNDILLVPPRAISDSGIDAGREEETETALDLDILAISELDTDALDSTSLLEAVALGDALDENLLTDPLSELDAELQEQLSGGFDASGDGAAIETAVGETGTTVSLASEAAAMAINVAAGTAQTLAIENDSSSAPDIGVGSSGGGGLISIIQRQ